MFWSSGFEETDINTFWTDVMKTQTTMYLRDGVDALEEQSKDLICGEIGRSTRVDRT